MDQPAAVRIACKEGGISGKKVALFATSGGSDITKAPGKLQPLMKGEIVGAKLFAADADRASIAMWLAKQYEKQGKVLIVAPDDIGAMKTLTRDKEAMTLPTNIPVG